jgi:hypothetical protein
MDYSLHISSANGNNRCIYSNPVRKYVASNADIITSLPLLAHSSTKHKSLKNYPSSTPITCASFTNSNTSAKLLTDIALICYLSCVLTESLEYLVSLAYLTTKLLYPAI